MTHIPDPCDQAKVNLRLLATSDLHMHLTGFDYYSDCEDTSFGLTRTAELIHAARREAEQNGALTLLLDNGDSMQGTPMGEWAANNPQNVHPLMIAFKHLAYDAVGLGNHDFNFGLELLLDTITQAPCPVVCSNLRGVNGQELPGIIPYALLDRTVTVDNSSQPIRIGVLSFLPPQTVQWDAHHLKGRVIVDDINQAAKTSLAALKTHNCDLVVVLAHCGLDDVAVHNDMENAVLPLAKLDGIDAIIAGHTHLHLPGNDHRVMEHVDPINGTVHGTPVVMPGTGGSHLGVIDLTIGSDQARLAVTKFNCALLSVLTGDAQNGLAATCDEDGELQRLLRPCHLATKSAFEHPVGQLDYPVHSYFSFCAPDRSLALLAAAQAAALRPMLSGTDAADLPLLSATSPTKFGDRSGPNFYTDVPAGPISRRHVADIYVFPNLLSAVIVEGRQVLQWLEQAAFVFCQITPGTSGMDLVDPTIPGYNFDVLHGLTWQIDVSCPHGHRISNVRFQDTPITPDQRFVVALNNYRANGGGDFTALENAEHLPLPRLSIHEAMCTYLSKANDFDPLARCLPSWQFMPLPGTLVRLQTGPGAAAYLSETGHFKGTIGNKHPSGFLALTVAL